MHEKQIAIKLVKTWLIDDIITLYKAGGWWKDEFDPNSIPRLIQGSYAFAVAVDTNIGKAIGMGRVLSDGISDAYIQDVVVLPEYRGFNIGKKIVQTLVTYCISNNIHWIGLIAEPNSQQFYTSIGFSQMKEYIPMLFVSNKGRKHAPF
ncbi:MAG: GNAT family N-acetyltransferase [Candidatus Thermoplasmatota archaeon]